MLAALVDELAVVVAAVAESKWLTARWSKWLIARWLKWLIAQWLKWRLNCGEIGLNFEMASVVRP